MKASITQMLLMLLLIPFHSVSQQFWQLTNEFWDGPKTGITLIDDTILLAATTTGILKSTNEGTRFEKILSASPVHTLFSSSQGTILAGGKGKIYYSNDKGSSWDSVALNSGYPVKQIIENSSKALYAITGVFDKGDGVFYSEDDGRSWHQRNNGLGNLKGCDKIAADRNGTLYLAISDEQSTGNGGLFISENNGLSWEKIRVIIDSFYAPLKITNTTGLSVSPDDSLYFSFYGVASNILVQLNCRKSINDITSENSWQVMTVHESSSWWLDRPLNNIHFSLKGDRYSSFTGTMNMGATYFSEKGSAVWKRTDHGLGVSENGLRNEQHFAESSSGRIYMVQYLDERIYFSDKSILTDVKKPGRQPRQIKVYPNPAKAGEKLKIDIPQPDIPVEISIISLSGKVMSKSISPGETHEMNCPMKPGIYIIVLKYQETLITEKILIN